VVVERLEIKEFALEMGCLIGETFFMECRLGRPTGNGDVAQTYCVQAECREFLGFSGHKLGRYVREGGPKNSA
jgi:hypothetical protein